MDSGLATLRRPGMTVCSVISKLTRYHLIGNSLISVYHPKFRDPLNRNDCPRREPYKMNLAKLPATSAVPHKGAGFLGKALCDADNSGGDPRRWQNRSAAGIVEANAASGC